MNDMFATSSRRVGLVDGILGVCAGAVGTAEVLGAPGDGNRLVAVSAVLICGLSLTQRRRHPDVALVLAVAPVAIAALAGVDLVERFTPFVVGMVAMASMAVHSSRPTRSPALVVVSASVVIVVARLAEFPFDIVYFSLQFALAWAAGFAVRRQLERVVSVTAAAVRRESELEADVESAISAERTRMASEIHDIVGHGISLMVVHAGAADQHADDPATVRRSTAAIQDVGRAALSDMARLLQVLHGDHAEIGMAPQPGIAGIRDLCTSVAATYPVDLTIDVDAARVPASVALTAYRVVQEALTNAVRHAPGGSATVTLREQVGHVEIRVETAGGTDPAEAAGTGRGLVGLQDRVRLFGGTFAACRTASGGFEVRASIPFTEVARR